MGWSTATAALDLGTDKEGFGFGGTGKKSFGKQFDPYGEVWKCFVNTETMFMTDRGRPDILCLKPDQKEKKYN